MRPTRRVRAGALMDRRRERYGVGALLHAGQGKWYPGEQLPRWSLNLFWRADGVPIRHAPQMIARERECVVPIWRAPQLSAGERDAHGATAATAREFLVRLARRLGVDARHVFA